MVGQSLRQVICLAATVVTLVGCGGSSSSSSHDLAGLGLVSTQVLPSGKTLDPAKDNVLDTIEPLAFVVTIQNTGDVPEDHVKVDLTIKQLPSPIVLTQTIVHIEPGQVRRALFEDLGDIGNLADGDMADGRRATVKVEVEHVPGETNFSNNSMHYRVILSIG